jgi:luciferase family oxidoreductase group 1
LLRLSVLDQSVALAGRPQDEAIRNTIALARYCEEIGYDRFWVSEHHSNDAIVGTAPEVLMAAIAAVTSRIRVGSAGIMLPHYAPLKVAEQFRVLDAIAPGRIDLGLGRAPGWVGLTALALNPMADQRPQQFPSDVIDLMAWVSGKPLRENHPFRRIKASPQSDTVPEMWMLGSSDYGAQVGAHFGLPYAFAWFFTDGQGGEEAIKLYKSLFKPSERHPKPHAGICVWALAAKTEAEAQFQFQSRARFRLLRDRGIFTAIETPEAAGAYTYSDAERARMEHYRSQNFVGTGKDVAARIRALAERLDLQEVAIVTWTADEEVRKESYRLILEAMRAG